jgi:ADP-heptose:LPS heptosyltransferase
MILKLDCKYFPGDRPCVFNKRDGIKCDDCPHYETAAVRILIIKLDAVGDVLRTTCILHGLKDKYPKSEITWITRKDSCVLFENNKMVDRILPYDFTETVLHTLIEEFDIVINLDSASDSSALASAVKGKEKLGYGLDVKGKVFPFNPEAITWLEMGAFDDVKKKNMRSFQDLMLEICKLKTEKKNIVLELSKSEIEFARSFAVQCKLNSQSPKIGLNTGASGRWQFKQWTLEGFEGLIKRLLEKTDSTILLYGGPLEKDRNAYLTKINPKRIINTGTENSLREFFALVSLSDIFVTGDTLALHAATALKKKTIALFGPTSAAEIDSYNGQIVKVQSELDCLVCYKPRCDFNPNCMNSITPEKLFSIIQQHLS